MNYSIGDIVKDEDGNEGIVGIRYNDGDFVFWPGGNDAAHPNPRIVEFVERKRVLWDKEENMGERKRYIIAEIGNEDWWRQQITESELRRRIMKIIDFGKRGVGSLDCDWKWIFDILLHGERKEPKGKVEPCYICKRSVLHEPWCSRGRSEEPEPNAETHDEWIDKMPLPEEWESFYSWVRRLQQWHREEQKR